jgi:hypothetical protein
MSAGSQPIQNKDVERFLLRKSPNEPDSAHFQGWKYLETEATKASMALYSNPKYSHLDFVIQLLKRKSRQCEKRDAMRLLLLQKKQTIQSTQT